MEISTLEILTFISTLLMAFYVFLTYRTFREIKKQTDFYHGALLRVIANYNEIENAEFPFHEKSKSANKHWKSLLDGNSVSYFHNGAYVELLFANRGNSDITNWEIFVKLEVEGGEMLPEEDPTIYKWKQIPELKNKLIQSGNEISVPLVCTYMFPKYKITWEVKYWDIRNHKYPSLISKYEGKMTI